MECGYECAMCQELLNYCNLHSTGLPCGHPACIGCAASTKTCSICNPSTPEGVRKAQKPGRPQRADRKRCNSIDSNETAHKQEAPLKKHSSHNSFPSRISHASTYSTARQPAESARPYSLADIKSKKKLVEQKTAELASKVEHYQAQLDEHSAVFQAALVYNQASCEKIFADADSLFDELAEHLELQRARFKEKLEAHISNTYCCKLREAAAELVDKSREELAKMQAGVEKIQSEGLTCYGSVYQNVAIVESYFEACQAIELRLHRLREQLTELTDVEPFNAKKDCFRELKEAFCRHADALADRRKLDRYLQGASVYCLRQAHQQPKKKKFLGIF